MDEKMTEEQITQLFRLDKLPEHMRGAMYRWLQHGIMPGSFGRAILENNLVGAFQKADSVNAQHILDYVNWLYNHAPGGCWGSPEEVRAWQRMQGLSNRNENHEEEK
jgi:hypothetical protein